MVQEHNSGSDMSSSSLQRDLRVDLIRGIALLMIFVDHVEWLTKIRFFSKVTLANLAYCDAAEVFFFLSGFVCGRSYGSCFSNHGWRHAQAKACKRILRLYVAHLSTLLCVMVLVYICMIRHVAMFDGYRVDGFDPGSLAFLQRVSLLIYLPGGFDILVVYMFLLLFLPTFVAIYSFNRAAALLVMASLYVASQFFPNASYPQYVWHIEGQPYRTFHTLAWQLIFMSAAAIGMLSASGKNIPVHQAVRVLFSTVVVTVAAVKLGAEMGVTGAEPLTQVIDRLGKGPLADKWTLGPFRLVYFGMLLVTVETFFSRRFPLRSCIARSLIGCGQNSLMIFCLILYATFLSHAIYSVSSYSPAAVITFESCFCGLVLWFGYIRFNAKVETRE